MAAEFVEDLLLGLGPRAKMGYYNAAVLFLKSTGRGHRYIYIYIEILRYAERERYIYTYNMPPSYFCRFLNLMNTIVIGIIDHSY